MSRAACSLGLVALGAWVLISCSSAAPALRARPSGGLLISGEPRDAEVFVDDRYVGTIASLSARALALGAGPHRIEVRHQGYFAGYYEVSVAPGVRQRLRVALRPVPF